MGGDTGKQFSEVFTLGLDKPIADITKGATGYGAYEEMKKEAERQKKSLAEEKALRDEQEAMVAEEQRIADVASTERSGRMSKGRKSLLSSTATGIASTLGGAV